MNGAKRIIVTAGGTGGHIFPALAVAEEMRRLGNAVLFVGSAGGPESARAKSDGFQFVGLKVAGFDRSSLLKTIKSLALLPWAVREAMETLSSFSADAVVGCGGYASGPSCIAAAIKEKPFFLLEQNVYPGLVTRRLAHRAAKIYASFPETRNYLERGNMAVFGNPTRREFVPPPKRDFQSFEKTLLVIGGSQGARSINKAVMQALPALSKLNLRIIHQTGESDAGDVRAAYAKRVTAFAGRSSNGSFAFSAPTMTAEPFFEDMADKMKSAHLAVARAGASSCAELLLTGLPSVLVPYPGAGGHQKYNALAMENCGASVEIDDVDLTGEILAEKISGLVRKPAILEKMSYSCVKNSRPGAARAISDDIMKALRN
ncbi:MAG: undecaprenyldiphospho-muramoylpentapeptide beta-N-acetylglucosaminyltransferase [Nitrospinae bacterium]|nr:undecaprenyldiphospho-muramoylpentapeptide beta-N-acetylglucosaminyltransferase [Nitrospinota bacterium]